MKRFSQIIALATTFTACLAAGCEQRQASESGTSSSSESASANANARLPADLFIAQAPADAQDVKSVKSSATVGDEVVMRGRVGGSVDPFVEGRAVFTIVDRALPACSDNPDDGCTTPWDYCCETREDILANAATIQVVDEAGQPVRTAIKGANGLEPGREVIVVGAITERDDAGNLVIAARRVHVSG